MFTQENTLFDGAHYRLAGALNNPQPINGDIPIMVGGSGERKTLRLVAQYADASNFFGDAERIRHLVGVLEGHCEKVGRDPDEITKTRLGTLAIGRTHEEAERKLAALGTDSAMAEQRRRMTLTGDPDSVAEQASELLDAGLDGLIFNFPDAHDLETIALAGQTLARLIPAERSA
jgi:alkanesulfonate monooxygenase SsuD/methylene tetrahydromethanopterin reductase-like flavin-dependent oxidoreductase (luciferase family)